MLSSFEMTRAHIDSLKKNCLTQVELSLPISQEVQEIATKPLPAEWFNNTEDPFTSTTVATITPRITSTRDPAITSTVKQERNIITEALFESLNEISCPFDCFENGNCENGKLCLNTASVISFLKY